MRKALLPLLFLGITGCQSIGEPTKTTQSSVIATSSQAADSSSYQPGEEKEYMFKEKPLSLQKYPIQMFCRTPKENPCLAGLNYKNYVGKKFYYTSEEPFVSDGFSGYGYYELMVETGETLYHYRKQKVSGVHDMDIIALKEKEAAQSFQEEPIVEGSSVMLTGIRRSSEQYGRTYDLSNGGTISESELSDLRKLSVKFGDKKARIADQLVNFHVTYDKMEDRFFIQPFPYEIRDTHVIGYIGYKDDSGAWLRAKALYKADNWLFIDKILVVADDFRLETKQVKFERDHTGGTIWEWMDVSATNGEFYDALVAISDAASATIRFNGRQYYKDFDIPEKQKEIITNILALFEDMKS